MREKKKIFRGCIRLLLALALFWGLWRSLSMDGYAAEGLSVRLEGVSREKYYASDVVVDVTVTDHCGETCSGIQMIAYEVYNMELPERQRRTQSGFLFIKQEAGGVGQTRVWRDHILVKASANNSGQVVVKVTAAGCDGNIVSESQSLRIDNRDPIVALTTRELEPSVESEGLVRQNIISGDLLVSYEINDFNGVWSSSGIYSVAYQVTSRGVQTQQGSLFLAAGTEPDGSDRVQNFLAGTILIDSEKNNSDDVCFYLEITDRAGNVTRKELDLKFDVTPPAISVQYMQNNPIVDAIYTGERTMLLEIREQHFAEENVKIKITGTEGGIPETQKWVYAGIDDTTGAGIYRTRIHFTERGIYTVQISCTDTAGNTDRGILWLPGTKNPTTFEIR